MEFYPHNTDITLIGTAVSSSQALTGSFINNSSVISATVVDLAGLALNISGARGTDGASYTSYGPTGSSGDTGVTGFRGNNIFLLSSAWSGSACGGSPGSCNTLVLYSQGSSGIDDCGSQSTQWVYYGTSIADNNILYENNTCTSVAANVPGRHNGSVIVYTDGAGVISTFGCAS